VVVGGLTSPRAARTRRFWLLCLSTLPLGSCRSLFTHHIALPLTGYPKLYASSVLSLSGLTYAFGSWAASFRTEIGRESPSPWGR
jgi:hypothetical protein